MPRLPHSKINHLLQAWPRGTVATQPWLTSKGVSSDLAGWYVRSGWLTRLGPRAFIQAGDEVDWRGGLHALQSQLAMTTHVGGRTALEMRGLAHFVPLGSSRLILLVSDNAEQLPSWFKRHPWAARVEHRTLKLFGELPENSTEELDCGGFQITISSPERAIMEEMRFTRTNADIEFAIQLMENLITLRPQLVQRLLEQCTAVKVKRLFLWCAEQMDHPWFDQLVLDCIDLGAGKRQLYKGGFFDPKYAITVPRQEDLPDV